MTTSITKSRAGHYTMTARNVDGQIVMQNKYGTLEQARAAAAKYKAM